VCGKLGGSGERVGGGAGRKFDPGGGGARWGGGIGGGGKGGGRGGGPEWGEEGGCRRFGAGVRKGLLGGDIGWEKGMVGRG